VLGVLRSLGAIQLDTIAVLARSHELVPYSRLGPVGRPAVEEALWGQPPRAFEYWSHAACLLPIEAWPWFAFRRRYFAGRVRRGPDPADALMRTDARAVHADALARLRADGPLTARELGGARRGGPWWDWSPLKRALEQLLATGEVVCVARRGWQRVYDLPERALPDGLVGRDPGDAACLAHVVAGAGAALGVATAADLAEHHRLRRDQVAAVLPATGLVPVRVRGWQTEAWADPAALDALCAGLRGRHRTTLLSPFDSLIWNRSRTERLFAFVHRLEAYLPRERRQHGYFVMPLLAGGRLAGRVDPARSGRTLVARQVSVLRSAVPDMARALREAAAWVGCDEVALGPVEPADLARPLETALAGA
jgi:uncharacterized protein YcaQ